MLLEVKNLSLFYDTAQILDNVSLEIDTGELVSVVGPNGAGKTSLLRSIVGLINWEIDTTKGTRLAKITYEGSITFDGKRIENLSATEITRSGLALCPERGRPFREMTVYENLMAGAYLNKDRGETKKNLEEVYELFPRLKERKNQMAGTLSGGERTMLAVGRALMYRPKLFCLDEPSTGLAPLVRDELFERIRAIYEAGMTMLLVEQDVTYAFELAKRNYVMSRGRIVAQGTADELLANERIRTIYLGL